MSNFEAEAEAHWKWFAEVLHVVYVGALLHGYKRGVEATRKETNEAVVPAVDWRVK